jgi:hypothetical protein
MSMARLTWWIVATILTVGFALLYFWYPALKMYRSSERIRYVITSERIGVKDAGGMFGSASTEEYPLRDLADVRTTATWFEQRTGVGTVTFSEYDNVQSEVSLTSIPNHEEVTSTIGGYQRREAKRGQHYAER